MIKNLGVFFVSALVSLFLAEGAVRLVVNPVDFLAITVEPEPVLGHHIRPGAGGHDDWGFRNTQVPDSTEILALGDSMTYGVMAKSYEAWPLQVGEITGKQIYNAGLGGYGPLQYLHVLRTRAPELSPSSVIVMVYPGNDLLDAYNLAYSSDAWSDYRSADTEQPTDVSPLLPEKAAPSLIRRVRDTLAHKSVLYRMVTQTPFFDKFRSRSIQNKSTTSFSYDHLGQTVILDPLHRLQFVDHTDPRIREAMDISVRALDEIARFCRENNIAFHVAMMPVREQVYNVVVDGLSDQQQTMMDQLANNMLTIETELAARLDALEIPWSNLRPFLETALQTEHVFPPADGHPNARGYRVVAEKLATLIPLAQ